VEAVQANKTDQAVLAGKKRFKLFIISRRAFVAPGRKIPQNPQRQTRINSL
jgi:hypothetical protein